MAAPSPGSKPRRPRLPRVGEWLFTRQGGLLVVVLLALSGVLFERVPAMRAFDLAVLDAKFALLARFAPIPAREAIAIVGIDEASLATLAEPLALSHRALGRAFAGLALAHPLAVGVDVILPDRSFETFAPGSDQALIAGLLALRRVAPVVIGVTTDDAGRLREVHPPLVAAAGRSAVAVLPTDDDGHVRRYDDRLGAQGQAVATLVGELARIAGVDAQRGLMQYALGSGYDYVPLARVLAWTDAGDRESLERAFGGRIVLVGAVLPHEDRKRLPVSLARWDATRDAPGVIVHAQALLTQLEDATVVEAPWPLRLAFLLVAGSLWFAASWRGQVLALASFALGGLLASVVLLRSGIELPLGSALRVAFTATALRSALGAWALRRDRARLRALFGGYVSPAVLEAILAGRLDADDTRRRTLAFLFADIRDFTALTASTDPEEVLGLLNRYFAAITPTIHEHGGTIDNFRGDGVMAIFGAPNDLSNPCNAAVAAARTMLASLARLNDDLRRAGLPALAIGVSLAAGEAVVGNVGSRDRYNYTAIGDAANVAARLQDVVKSSGCPIVAADSVVRRLTGEWADEWIGLGTAEVRGHGAVAVWGLRPGA